MLAKIRDTELYFDVEGAGLVPDGKDMREKPVLFVVPGGPGGDHAGFKPGLSPLAERAQLVYLDHRGCGRSARGPVDTYTMDNHVEDIEALRVHLGLREVGLLGISYGGMVAQEYAIRYGSRLSHLILVVTAPDHRFMARAQEILRERGTPYQQQIAQRLWNGEFETPEQMVEYFETLGPIYSAKFDLAEERSRRFIFSPDSINAAYGGYLHDYNVLDDLHAVSAPTLVIGAQDDWICAPEFSVEIAERIPGADLRLFENCGHNVHVDEREGFLDVVKSFLACPPAILERVRTTERDHPMTDATPQVTWDYTKLAATYTQRPSYAPRAVDRIVETCGIERPRVADIGAGNAHLTVDLLSRHCVVDAVEPNDAMREIGIGRTVGESVRWSVGTGEATGLPAGSYDLVTFGSSFATTERPTALVETARILRDRGWFACIWNHRDLEDPLQAEVEAIIGRHIRDYSYGVRREDQAPVIESSGLFDQPVVLSERVVHRVPVADWLAAWRSHGVLERQAGDGFEKILAEIDDLVLARGGEEIEVPYHTVGWLAQVQ